MVETTLLSKEEKAQELGITIRTITNRMKKGKIRILRIHNSKRPWFLPEGITTHT